MKFVSGFFGGMLTGSGKWSVELKSKGLILNDDKPIDYFKVWDIDHRSGVVWNTLTLSFQNGKRHSIDIVADECWKLEEALRLRVQKAITDRIERFGRESEAVLSSFDKLLSAPLYLTASDKERWLAGADFSELAALVHHPLFDRDEFDDDASELARKSVGVLCDLDDLIEERNNRFATAELKAYQTFFDTVEKTPLTHEQRLAAVVMEDRNLLIAAAGSGKTSVIVGKVGYALQRGYAKPDEVLVLAFNNFAVQEIEERINERLRPILGGQSIKVQTFHALGQEIIAKAEGRKPSLSNEAAGNELTNVKLFRQLIDELVANDQQFAHDWILFRTLCLKPARNPAEFASIEEWKEYVSATAAHKEKREGYPTLRGDLVKSQGEQAIANWLFMNGIQYEYERPYKYQTANQQYRQYRPDFYFPDIDCYLEHYALDANGNPPPAFGEKYHQSRLWKQSLHEQMGTRVIETTFHEFVTGSLFSKLEAQLKAHGQVFAPKHMDGILAELNALQEADYGQFLSSFLRTFVKHAKSNGTDLNTMRSRAARNRNVFRATLFASLGARIVAAYNQFLQQKGEIDFEDMILTATQHAEQESFSHPYRLILVDEFQDISQDRARLAKAILSRGSACKLFAVGDDWQSIYRFAGADISLFTGFERVFGATKVLFLSQTFRSNQGIADVATRFVTRHGTAFDKQVKSSDATFENVVEIRYYQRQEEMAGRLVEAIEALYQEACATDTLRSVFILGRYNRLFDFLPDLSRFADRLEIIPKTIHGSKGLQADYVIVLGLIEGGAFAFPSGVADDPLMALVMPDPETTPNAEERRLMYVALTRAKHKAILIGRKFKPSRFLAEIAGDQQARPMVRLIGGESDRGQRGDADMQCPRCSRGTLRLIDGKYGPFYGCSNHPACGYTRNAGSRAAARREGARRRQSRARPGV